MRAREHKQPHTTRTRFSAALLSCLTLSLPVCWLAGCASAPRSSAPRAADGAAGNAPSELLDENSGETLIVVRRPIVLARSRTDVAANVRDYVTLVAAQEDRGGKYSTWLVAHNWSTVDPRIDATRSVGSARLLLIGDGRTITLTPAQPQPLFVRRGDLLFAPSTSVASWAYAVDLPTLRYLAAASDLSLRWNDDALPVPYTLWADGRPELLGLLDNAIAPAAAAH